MEFDELRENAHFLPSQRYSIFMLLYPEPYHSFYGEIQAVQYFLRFFLACERAMTFSPDLLVGSLMFLNPSLFCFAMDDAPCDDH